MDYKAIGFSTLGVFGVLLISGTIISLLSSQLQCSKIGFVQSLIQGSISSVLPSLVYAGSVMYIVVRKPFSSTLEKFGIPAGVSEIVAVGYLVMLTSWITAMWNIHNTQKSVCKPDLKEMSDFKKKLLNELQEKERQKEEHATKK